MPAGGGAAAAGGVVAAPVGLRGAGARARAALGALTARSSYFGICKTNPTPNSE